MPTRRGFVTSMLGAGAALATQGPHKAAAQVNRRLIVDAQVHLWKAESPTGNGFRGSSRSCRSPSPSSG